MQEALGLAELLTDPAFKIRALQQISEQLREQVSRESEWLEILMRAFEVAQTIQDSSRQAEALSALSTVMAQAQQWAEAERVIGTIQDSSQQAAALSALSTTMAQAQQWEHASQVRAKAERVISTIQGSDQQAWALRYLATEMARADELEQLLHLIQHTWRQVETREKALTNKIA
jgi:hypothetical protein